MFEHMEDIAVFPDSYVLPLIGSRNRVPFDVGDYAYHLKLNSSRLKCFAKNPCCAKCGLRGEVFILQRVKGTDEFPHLNFFGIDEEGDLVMMTKDHIIPRSKGGPDAQDNLQTMCYPCNQAKGNNE